MERKLQKACGGGFEFIMSTEVTFQQSIVTQYMSLPYSTFHRGNFVGQRTAAVGNLCCLIHSFPAMVRQAIYRKGAIDERDDQREAHKGEAQQDQFQERAGIAAQPG